MKKATLCFLRKDGQLLLGMKKQGFGAGRWNGFGGKVETGESIEEAAARELYEESGVKAKNLEKAAILHFRFPQEAAFAGWDQEVHVFLTQTWEGEPAESEEMQPAWHPEDALPFDAMWPDDAIWLPRILQRERIAADFRFADADTIAEYTMYPLN